MKKVFNYFLYSLLLITPMGWVILWMSYTTWQLYKQEGYIVPSLLKWWHIHNFEPYTSPKKPN